MRVLAVGAHPDDIELGCAGALLRHVQYGDEVALLVMTSGESGPQADRPRVAEQERAAELLGAELLWGGFSDGYIPTGREAVSKVDSIVRHTGADIIYTHAPRDTHQDHVATAQAAIAAGRKVERVLCFQSPTTTVFNPALFVDIDTTLPGKVAALAAHHSQVQKCDLVDLEAVEAGARFWGFRARIAKAEPFEVPHFVWDIAGRAGASVIAPAASRAGAYPPLRVVRGEVWNSEAGEAVGAVGAVGTVEG
jgi:LmbE family N-acetylglucosaminyl deacetylase